MKSEEKSNVLKLLQDERSSEMFNVSTTIRRLREQYTHILRPAVPLGDVTLVMLKHTFNLQLKLAFHCIFHIGLNTSKIQ